MDWTGVVRRLAIVVTGAAIAVMSAVGVHSGGLGPDPVWAFDCGDTSCIDLWATARHHYQGVALCASVVAFVGWLTIGAALPAHTSAHPTGHGRSSFLPTLLQSGLPAALLTAGVVFSSYAMWVSLPLVLACGALMAGGLTLLQWQPLRRRTGRERASWFAATAAAAATLVAGAVTTALCFPFLFILAPYPAVPVMVAAHAVGRWMLPTTLAPRDRRPEDKPEQDRSAIAPRRRSRRADLLTGVGSVVVAAAAVVSAWPVPAPPADAVAIASTDTETPTQAAPKGPAPTSPRHGIPPASESAQSAPDHLPPAGLSACRLDALRLSVTGWDAFTGNSVARIVATNTGDSPCALVGRPVIDIEQGGEDLRVRNEPLPAYRAATSAPLDGTGLAPGDSASAGLFWPGYRNAADQETPESVRIRLTAAGGWAPARTAPGAPGPAPFDLVEGAVIQVGLWSPEAG